MRLRLIFSEEQIKGNQRRREAEGLPWLEYHATHHTVSEAIVEAEKTTGRTIRVGLWTNRGIPGDVIIVGKWVGDPDEPQLPLCTVRGATLPRGEGGVPPQPNRASSTDRVLAKLAIRLIRLEKKVSFYRLLTLFTLMIGLIVMAWMIALLFSRR